MVGLGVQFARRSTRFTPVSGSDLNQASIAVGNLPGAHRPSTATSRTSTGSTEPTPPRPACPASRRTVTPADAHFGGRRGEALHGHLHPDGRGTSMPWAIGSLTWTDGSHDVRSPDHACGRWPSPRRPKCTAKQAPAARRTFDVTPGFTGTSRNTVVRPRRRHARRRTASPSAHSTSPTRLPTPTPSSIHVVVPAGTRAARFSLDADTATGRPRPVRLQARHRRPRRPVGIGQWRRAGDADRSRLPATYDVYVNGFAGVGRVPHLELRGRPRPTWATPRLRPTRHP